MTRQSVRDTTPELELRHELSRRGLQFEVHGCPLPGFPREADVIFFAERVAVFVDGCFWHGCPTHTRGIHRAGSRWRDRIEENRIRDYDTNGRLTAAGWVVVRVWEHESPVLAADRVAEAVGLRTSAEELI
ncbi:very short patch repair endonuclease [Mycolicibacterium sp. XJ2546]